MNRIQQGFDELQFTLEEKRVLAERLVRAAEENTMQSGQIKRQVRKLSRGMIIGLAAALILTIGAMAAVLTPAWGGLFHLQASEEQALLEKLTYEIGETQWVDGWEVTLSRCAGDDRMLYIWVEMKAPEGFTYEPPEEYMDLYARWNLTVDGKRQTYASGNDRISWDESSRTITYCSGWPTADSVAGKTGNIVVEPPCWSGSAPDSDSWIHVPLWEGDVVFTDVKLAYPNHTIRLTPDVEVPYLNGTATLTRLEFSPFRAFARVDGGSCYFHHHYWVKSDNISQAESEDERDGYQLVLGTIDCWSQLTVEFHMKDGTVVIPRSAVPSECQDGFNTEGHVYAGECYVERRMEYESIPLAGIPDRIIDPDQVEYVTVCGVDIPISGTV
ncbi:MAG: DUF4179 domain-containing protein [Lawsonibacter sp.]|jgi:hypothetical protein